MLHTAPDRCTPLFSPASIAVVGVSTSEALSWGRITVQRLLTGGFSGELTAVTRRECTLPGARTVRSLDEIGYGPDLVILAVPAHSVPGLLREARGIGAGSAIVFSAGFGEAGEHELQEALCAAAGELPVLGPNCLGLVSRAAGVHASTTGFLDRDRMAPGPVAVIAQSGAMGFVLADLLEQAGLGYSYYASVGNEACLGVAELGAYLLAQPDAEVLVLYLEGVRNATGLRALARQARAAGKSVVALTAGRSTAGKQAALSHTAAAAGDHLLLASLCRQEGIRLVTEDEQLVDAVLCARKGHELPPAPRLAVLTMSGGAGGVLADNLVAMGARVPELSVATRAQLAAIGGIEATDANPVDLGGNIDRWLARVDELLAVLDGDTELDGIVLYLTFGDRFPDAYHHLARAVCAMRTPTWFVWACAPPGELERLGQPETVLPNIGALLRRLRVLLPDAPAPSARPPETDPPGTDTVTSTKVTEPGGTCARVTYSELRSAPLLTGAGIGHVPTAAATNAPDLVEAVHRRGWPGPYVIKGDAADVPHRAAAGLVRPGVSATELAGTAAAVAARLEQISTDPDRRLVAQPLIEHTGELTLGAVRDPVYGTAVLLGAGGSRAEEPSAPRRAVLLPVTEAQIVELLGWAVTTLGAPPAATRHTLEALFGLLQAQPELAEVDINPLCVTGEELLAVDALFTYWAKEASHA